MVVDRFKNPKVLIAAGGVLLLVIVTVILVLTAPGNTCEECIEAGHDRCRCNAIITTPDDWSTDVPPDDDCPVCGLPPANCDCGSSNTTVPDDRRFNVTEGDPIIIIDLASGVIVEDKNVVVNANGTITITAPNEDGVMTEYTIPNPLIAAVTTSETTGNVTTLAPPPTSVITDNEGRTTVVTIATTAPPTAATTPATTSPGPTFQGISLSANAITANVAGVEIQDLIIDSVVIARNAVARITAPGTYVVTGTINNGQIVVDTEGTVNVILRNAHITCRVGPAFRSADRKMRVTLTSENGTTNSLIDSRPVRPDLDNDVEPQTDDPAWRNGAVYFRNESNDSSFIITGRGALTVRGGYQHGINSRTSLTITNARVTIHSASHGTRSRLQTNITTNTELKYHRQQRDA
jgi:hypothetical protein